MRKEVDIALDETKDESDLKPKPSVTGDELCVMSKSSLPSSTF